ncbi:MAG: HU family DNA-binding protein [Deinococcales bacterium]|nr:HU family DNA-binding protein [Deinococcales bacterium]
MLCVEAKMNKSQLIDQVATESGLSKKQAGAAVNAVFDAIQAQLASGGTVSITGFGTFEVRERAARDGVKPGTTEKIRIPASKAPAFKAGKTLKDAVKGS